MDWKQAHITRIRSFIDSLDSDLNFLEHHHAELTLDGVDVTQEWITRYRGRADELRALLAVAELGD